MILFIKLLFLKLKNAYHKQNHKKVFDKIKHGMRIISYDSYIIESSLVGLEGNYFVESVEFVPEERNIYNLCYLDNLFNAKQRHLFERKIFSSRKI